MRIVVALSSSISSQPRMPKHVPTFKHLIASSSRVDDPPQRRQKGVNDLLASARVNRPVIREDSDERIWTPGVNAGAVASTSAGLVDIDNNVIHP
jgi:hypothetical protein